MEKREIKIHVENFKTWHLKPVTNWIPNNKKTYRTFAIAFLIFILMVDVRVK